MGEPDLFGEQPDPLPPSPLAELDPAARERARMVLSRQLPGRRVCSCGGLIVDALTEAGESTVVDAEPAEHGGSIVLEVDGNQIYARTVDRKSSSTRAAAAAGVALHRAHWASCPHADMHRRRAARAQHRGRR